MKKDLTEIVFILDRSGSMGFIAQDAIGGFNAFLKEQKEAEGEANMTVVLFDHEIIKLADGVDIHEVEELNDETYVTRGLTALYDAIGVSIDTVGKRLAETPEEDRPEKVVFAIMTDGDENHSKTFSGSKIKKMVEHQTEKYNWQFLFLGANIDSVGTAKSLGINPEFAGDFIATSKGTMDAYNISSGMVRSYRSGAVMDSFEVASKNNEQE